MESVSNFMTLNLSLPVSHVLKGSGLRSKFLSIPAEIRPEPASIGADFSADYVERRRIWREKGSPNPTLGDFIDLKNWSP